MTDQTHRVEMPCHEFDGVDFFCNQPGRGEMPPLGVQAYFDSGMTWPKLADRIGRIVADMTALLARTTAKALTAHVDWVLHGTERAKSAAWNEDGADALRADLRTHRIDVLYLAFEGDGGSRWLLDAWAYPFTEDVPDAAITMSLAGENLWPDEASDTVADEILALLRGWAEPLKLRTGGVTYDRSGPHRSPWDRWYATGHQVTAALTAERLRGYYWANLLTSGHLNRLGGLTRLAERAAEHGLTTEAAGPDAVDVIVVRAPVPITAFDGPLLAAAKHVLGPAMIHQQYAMYLGYPLRIIPDPGTAFRRVPPGSPFPHLLNGRGPYADEVP